MAKSNFGSALMGLPWIVRVLVAIFLDFIYGIARLIDGLQEGNLIKIVLGFLWIFYGLGIGWVADIICTLLNIRPLFL